MRPLRTLALTLGLLAGAGCYHYVPVSVMLPQGTPMRLHLNTLSSFELNAITVNNINQVEGEMVRVDGTDVVLSATWLEAITNNGYAGNGWTVRIPESNVTAVEQKRFSWWRSGVVMGALVVGTTLGFDALGVNIYSNGGGGTGGSTK
jgi:hypothetical protein